MSHYHKGNEGLNELQYNISSNKLSTVLSCYNKRALYCTQVKSEDLNYGRLDLTTLNMIGKCQFVKLHTHTITLGLTTLNMIGKCQFVKLHTHTIIFSVRRGHSTTYIQHSTTSPTTSLTSYVHYSL